MTCNCMIIESNFEISGEVHNSIIVVASNFTNSTKKWVDLDLLGVEDNLEEEFMLICKIIEYYLYIVMNIDKSF